MTATIFSVFNVHIMNLVELGVGSDPFVSAIGFQDPVGRETISVPVDADQLVSWIDGRFQSGARTGVQVERGKVDRAGGPSQTALLRGWDVLGHVVVQGEEPTTQFT